MYDGPTNWIQQTFLGVFVQVIEKLWLHEKQATKALAARRKGSVHRVSGTLALHAVTLYLSTHHLFGSPTSVELTPLRVPLHK